MFFSFGSDVQDSPNIEGKTQSSTCGTLFFFFRFLNLQAVRGQETNPNRVKFPNLCLLKVCLKGVAENFQTLEDFNPWLSTWACKPPSQLLVLVLAAQITVFCFPAILSHCCATKPKSTISLGLKPSKKPVTWSVDWGYPCRRYPMPHRRRARGAQWQKMGFNPFKEGFTGDLVGYVRYVL